jgi:endonuclease/exonuclease/phosphatase family metal-dependent hydrolase
LIRPKHAASLVLIAASSLAQAQWNPSNRQWGKDDADDYRVVTFNIQDRICSTNAKQEGQNSWTAIAVQIAALRPDVLVMVECGDNSANGTGAAQGYNTVDTVARLAQTLNLLVNGGTDPYVAGNPAVTSYVTKYTTGYALPYVYVSDQTDNFNRNVVLSRFPLADLNGDGRTALGTFTLSADPAHPYYTAGNAGVRGYLFAEINLPDDRYGGDFVIGGGHLKAGGAAADLSERLVASQRIAYYIDAIFNGLGGTAPDPNFRCSNFPRPNKVLTAQTPVVWAGDFNEDESTNGRDGPVLWTTRAAAVSPGATDGTDRDRTDSAYDDSRDPFTNNRNTQGSNNNNKLDFICWQDSIASLRRSFVFRASTMPSSATPPEFASYPGLWFNISSFTDHRAVVADFVLPVPQVPNGHLLSSPADTTPNLEKQPTLAWTAGTRVTNYSLTVSANSDLSSPIYTSPVAASGPYTLQLPAGLLSNCGIYYWSVSATNRGGTALSPSGVWNFQVRGLCDINIDGFVDDTDFVLFATAYDLFETTDGDFTGDGFTDDSDFVIFAGAYDALLACP